MAPFVLACRGKGARVDRTAGLLAAIKAVHGAGLDPDLWPRALGSIMDLTGSRAGVLETYAHTELRPRAIHSWNMRPATRAEYLAWGGPPNPRGDYVRRLGAGEISYDSCLFDEADIDRDPFHVEFLAHHDCRYFMSGVIERDREIQVVLTLPRTALQGHVGPEEIELLALLIPHIRLALQVQGRLAAAERKTEAFGEALEWLPDAAALLAADGQVLHTNAALSEMAAAQDGICLAYGRLGLPPPAADALARVLGQAARLCRGEGAVAPDDFRIPRPSGGAAYVAAVRPLFAEERAAPDGAVAVLFLRDPDLASMATPLADLTAAEVALAAALLAGVSPVDHARERGVSINTVYTHLRRLKEKTGARRLTDLLRRLQETAGPARPAR